MKKQKKEALSSLVIWITTLGAFIALVSLSSYNGDVQLFKMYGGVQPSLFKTIIGWTILTVVVTPIVIIIANKALPKNKHNKTPLSKDRTCYLFTKR